MIKKKRFIDRLSYQAGPNTLKMPWQKLAAGQPLREMLRLRYMQSKNARMIANQYRGLAPVSDGTRAVPWRKF